MVPESLISDLVDRLKRVDGVRAIVLGGSYASGSQRPDSDIDLGIYYGPKPLAISGVRRLAAEINDYPDPVVTDPGDWGRWVNGGAWLTVKGQRVDFLYRDIDFVSRILDDCLQGRRESDYNQQPPFGFQSYMYCAEVQVCKVLYDPDTVIAEFKSRVSAYPQPLKESIVQGFMWEADFSLAHARKAASRGDILITAGCLARIANDLVQVIYALNETYFLTEKRFPIDEDRFSAQPMRFAARLSAILGGVGKERDALGRAVGQMEELFLESKELGGDLYKRRYG